MTSTGLVVAVVGLGFGEQFVPIYLSHPDVASVVLIEPDEGHRREVAERYAISTTYPDLDRALLDSTIDAVHILAPVPFHADMAVAALKAGRHCACAVPMATSLPDIERIIAAQEASGCNYMMMETSLYGREYLTIEEMHQNGDFGELTLYRGFHIQNLDGYPNYWKGYPPMHYLTHALSPILGLLDTTVSSVQARGAGKLTAERTTGHFDNPFPAEVGLFQLHGSDILVDITMSFFQTARSYIEGFSLYGEHRGIEWPPTEEADMAQFDMFSPRDGNRGNAIDSTSLTLKDFAERLPDKLAPFTHTAAVQLDGMPSTVTVGADHGGLHPHLVNEFVASIVEHRPPRVDVIRSAELTAPGIYAHQSAMEGGTIKSIPAYR